MLPFRVMVPLITAFALGPTVEIIERLSGWNTVERAFHAAALPLEIIDERRVFIPYAAEAFLIEHAARAIGEANLGFYLGREFSFSELGNFGRYASMAPNLATALTRALRGIRYATSSGTFGMQILGNRARISYSSGIQGAPGVDHVHAGSLLIVINLFRRFAGPNWIPISIELDRSNSADAKALEQLFGVPVAWNCQYPAILFDAELLERPNLHPATTREQLTFTDLKEMVRSGPQRNLRSRVQAILRLRLLEGQTDIERSAEALNVGPRTLQRRLSRENVTYIELVEEVRRERAISLLSETTERVIDIALALGYSSPGHFIRAFRRWTGDTPAAYRSHNLMNV